MGNLLELSLHSQLLVLSIYHGNVFQPWLSFFFLFSFVLSSPKKFGRYAYGCIELFNGQKPYRCVVCLSGASISWMIMSSLFAYSSSFASIKKKYSYMVHSVTKDLGIYASHCRLSMLASLQIVQPLCLCSWRGYLKFSIAQLRCTNTKDWSSKSN